MRLPIAELGEQRQPRLVAEGGEDGGATTSLFESDFVHVVRPDE
jgi:hypothetical protein